MSDKVSITVTEWLNELQAASKHQPENNGFMSVEQIRQVMVKKVGACSPQRVRNLLRQALAEGRLELGTVKILRIDGAPTSAPGYRIKPVAKKARR